MKIEFTKKQYEELLLLVGLGNWVRGAAAELHGKYNIKMNELEDYIFAKAKEFGVDQAVEVDGDGKATMSDEFAEKIEEMMEEYDEDEFWSELSSRLGRRDYFKTITPEEKEKIEKDQWLTRRVDELYSAYDEEFEKHGIDRLEVVK